MSDIYDQLLDKLDTLGKGYPRTEKGVEMDFIKKVFSEEDARFHIKMRPGLHSAEETAEYMGILVDEAAENLERMAAKHLLFWQYMPNSTMKKYRLIPFIHGIWEFNVDQINIQDARNMGYYYPNGMGESLFDYRLPISRVIPLKPDVVKDDNILPFDDAEAIIKQQSLIVVQDCACRAVGKFGKPCSCSEDLSICMNFGDTARFLLEENVGNPRVLTTKEALDIVRANDEKGLFLQVGHSIPTTTICSCAPCHCGLLMAAKIANAGGEKHGKTTFHHWGNYKCAKDADKCINCGICAKRCPMRAMKTDDEGNVFFNRSKCMGCGLCVTQCHQDALILERKPQAELLIPEDTLGYDTFDRMAREKAAIDAQRAELG